MDSRLRGNDEQRVASIKGRIPIWTEGCRPRTVLVTFALKKVTRAAARKRLILESKEHRPWIRAFARMTAQ